MKFAKKQAFSLLVLVRELYLSFTILSMSQVLNNTSQISPFSRDHSPSIPQNSLANRWREGGIEDQGGRDDDNKAANGERRGEERGQSNERDRPTAT